VFRRLQAEAVAGFIRHLAKGWQLHVNIETLTTTTNPCKVKAFNFLNAFKQVLVGFSLSFPHFLTPFVMFMEASSQPQVASCNSGKTGLQGYSAFFLRSLDSAAWTPPC
jgi:hypothetical protein